MPILIMNAELLCYGQERDDYVRQEFFLAKSFGIEGHSGVSAIAFDEEEELIWTGSQLGLVSSYYGLNAEPYSSFQVHNVSEVRHLLTCDRRILSLTPDSLACSSKLGHCLYNYRSPSFSEMQCALLSPPNHLILGGLRSNVIEFDIETKTELQNVEIGNTGNVILRFSNSYLCSGNTCGEVSLLDPHDLTLIRTLEAHTGSLSDFDVCGNQLITCGFSLKNGQHIIDRHLMMFDLRYFRAMAPMQVVIDPMYLRFVQTYSNQICVVSQNGQFQNLELGCSGYQSPVYDVPVYGGHLTSCSLSSSNMVLAFGETSGYVHMFVGNHENPVFNHFSVETEFATNSEQELAGSVFGGQQSVASYYPETEPSLMWINPENHQTADSLSGLPVYRNPAETACPMYGSMAHSDAFFPANQMKSNESEGAFGQKVKARNLHLAGCRTNQGGDDQSIVIPKCYRKVEIKYSKYGVDGFDFRSYNKTNFAGLETHIPNAYCNAMIQVLYFIEPLRNTVMSHLCDREFCLSCELGFLFNMLQQQTTKTCQATNFLRAFRTIPQVTALGLVLSDSDEAIGKVNLVCLSQSWNRFILQQIDSELASVAHHDVEKEIQQMSGLTFKSDDLDQNTDALQIQEIADQCQDNCGQQSQGDLCNASDDFLHSQPVSNLSIIKQLFSYDVSIVLLCKVCGESLERKKSLLIVDLVYPESSEAVKVPFSKIVERSLNNENKMRSWCASCNKYQVHNQNKALHSLPDILTLHCHLDSPSDFAFWRAQEQNTPKVSGVDISAASAKPCRYGSACTRPDCRFRHDKPKTSSVYENSQPLTQKRAWVSFGLRLFLTPDGKVRVSDTETEEPVEQQGVCYELVASVACIKGGGGGGGGGKSGSHLVSHIMAGREPSCSKKVKGPSSGQWYLFNDFAISPVNKHLAVSFEMDWKFPCHLYFAKMDINTKYNIPVVDPITSDVLFASESIVTPRISNITFMPLQADEHPQEGDIVGLDAEFVKLNPEEAELHSDGTKSTIKPSQMSVARVTCIREKGPLSGVPFIDDYICTQEQVVDYLTEFSGIEPGDLDPAFSCKYLTTLKTTYLKLQYLINAKVIFVGHGLKKDFRVLNLVVPSEQVVDTVELFHLPKRRMISLKFLAWYFLGLKIQSRNHDSIEDSITAIRLYYKYLELSTQGSDFLHDELDKLYEMGQLLSWHIPEDEEPVNFGSNSSNISHDLNLV